MSRAWKPGDVAMVSDPAYGDLVMIRVGSGAGACWHGTTDKDGMRCLSGTQAGDIRPLVVIDPEDREQVERFTQAWREVEGVEFTDEPWAVDGLRMQAALREFADPTPRIVEPTGLGAVVEDAKGGRWAFTGDRLLDNRQWWYQGDEPGLWADINVVRVLSEGIS